MLVKELIKRLKARDQNMEVLVSDRDGYFYSIDFVRYGFVREGVENLTDQPGGQDKCVILEEANEE